MFYLLQLEWKKFRKHVMLKVLVLFYIILLPTVLLIGKEIQGFPEEFGSIDMIYIFPGIWQYLGYVGNWLCFFLFGFFAVLICTIEYSNKTLRQNIITGLKRSDFFKAKIAFILTVSLFATLYYVLISVLFGVTHTETIFMSKVLQNADLIPRYFLMCFGYMSFGLFLGILLRRTGLALFIYLIYAMFGELVLRYAIHLRIVKNKSVHFYPMNAIEDLVPMPVAEAIGGFADNYDFSFFLSPLEAIITTIVYTTLFLFISYRYLVKSDL